MRKVPIHVEVVIGSDVAMRTSAAALTSSVQSYLREYCPLLSDGPLALIYGKEFNQDSFAAIHSVTISGLGREQRVSFWEADSLPEKECLEGEDDSAACLHTDLPSKSILGLWESIVVSADVKEALLGYCSSSVLFSDAHIDSNIISWNRILLLYGPPGTGKTTLCKALAQKVFIRSGSSYKSALLIEVSSHSLFSKWFSESGKLVVKLFDHITEAAEDQTCLVFVLIDEVESIVSSRSASSSSDPGDAVRVVNAVLTCLDQLRALPNVLVLCTSNMLESIDEAFLDRVDFTLLIGLPNKEARYNILRSCLLELMRSALISPTEVVSVFPERMEEDEMGTRPVIEKESTNDKRLLVIADRTEGLSGRSLRKLPLRAHAQFIQRPQVALADFLKAMYRATEI